ncbi:MAG: hypothetical protein MUO63_14150 [Desulfobulbaceae bacterium]|nr:hypothetical protein [Desulfobulbaceae bacterium]
MAKKDSNDSTDKGNGEKEKNSLSTVLDSFCKILGPAALIFVAFIANSFQSKMSATSIITQREQAESQLRASMFSNLIDPIVGKEKGGGEDDINRIKLLTELLVLNFHEHFEFKPLLEYVGNRIVEQKASGQPVRQDENNTLASLYSVSRRVIDKQISILTREGAKVVSSETLAFVEKQSATDGNWVIEKQCPKCPPYSLDLGEKGKKKSNVMRIVGCTEKNQYQGGNDFSGRELNVYLYDADWDKQQFRISFMMDYKDDRYGFESSKIFTLSWFDFPLTDNHFLKDGNRFSIILDNVSTTEKAVSFRIIWFPKHYFTIRERPITTKDFLDKLDLDSDEKGFLPWGDDNSS